MVGEKPKLYIIDGYSLIYRSYFAFINRPLKDMEGNNVSALFGFLNTLLMINREYQPDYLVVAMDMAEPTFRHKLYEQYKANRDAAPQDLHSQVPLIKEALEAANIPILAKEGMEADDIIASLITCAQKQNIQSVMVTGDKDLLQLVGEDVFALRPPKKGQSSYHIVGFNEVIEEFEIKPNQIVDYLAIVGDSSDNVPGVAGIGPKGAVKLLTEFDNLDNIYKNLDSLSPSVAKKLGDNKEMAYLSKELVTLRDDLLRIENFNNHRYESSGIEWEKMAPILERVGFKSLINALGAKREKVAEQKSALNQKGTYHQVTSIKELETLLEKIAKTKIMAFDFETTSIDEMSAKVVGFSFTNTINEGWYVPLIASDKPVLNETEVKKVLKYYLGEKQISLVGQNLKYEYKITKRWLGIKPFLYFDTMIAAWLLDSSSDPYNLDYLAEKYLDGYKTISYNDVVPDKNLSFASVAIDKAVAYGSEDADISWRLYQVFLPLLEKEGLTSLFNEVEMPLITILSEMELAGIRVDEHKLKEIDKEITNRIGEIEKEVYKQVGYEFNINSTKQLQEVLFEQRQLPFIKKTKTGYSTDTDTLEKLATIDIVPRLILENRVLAKLKNTYVEPLPKLINKETGRVHTSYGQTGTATGRLSSRNPNLQNIPIRSEEGRRIREAFIPKEGCLFLAADYSQIELVVLAHMADDNSLKEAFLKGQDIHRHTASLIFNTDLNEVTSQQRQVAKTINFGVMYGMSAFRLSNELAIPRKEAQTFIDNYFNRFGDVKEFMQQLLITANETKSVSTLLGRKRHVAEIASRNRMEQAQAERIVINTAIQGTAADIMKLAMIKVANALKKENLKSRLLLQVHDELIFEVEKEELGSLKKIVVYEMENSYKLSIPLRVSVEVGPSWGNME
ncbi:MAG: DNA polymerase I [Sphaerochaetaceae bacterium]